ncbi:MAG: hypothetical protein ACK4FJ_18505 [Ferrovibrio sp.]|uniref:hypothetical protein n=1 Tax=Ferrovibrio sp. TaxID=1917215 RepID=UPI00391A502A
MEPVDVETINHGSVIALRPRTEAALDWITANVQSEGWQWLGRWLCVEPCFASDIIDAMQADGLAVG